MKHIEWLRELGSIYEEADEVADELIRLQRENEKLLLEKLTLSDTAKSTAKELTDWKEKFWKEREALEAADAMKRLQRENEELRDRIVVLGEWLKEASEVENSKALSALSNDEFARAERSEALVADFKRRAYDLCRYKGNEYAADLIDSLPLIEGEK